jgi:hypothetical protein
MSEIMTSAVRSARSSKAWEKGVMVGGVLQEAGFRPKPLLHPDDPYIVAVASDQPLPTATVPVIDLNDIDDIANLLLKHAVPANMAMASAGCA